MTDAHFASDIAAVLAKLKQDRARPDLPLLRKVSVNGTPAIPIVPPNTPATSTTPFATPARSRAASVSLGNNKSNGSNNGSVASTALSLNTNTSGTKSLGFRSELDDAAERSFSTIATAGSSNALWEGEEEEATSSGDDEEHVALNHVESLE